jgi:hypothetical protein
MPTLRNPQKQIPGGGYDFRQPEISWHARKTLGLHPSLDVVTRSLISARKAHPHHAQKHNWAMDFNSVHAEVVAYNVRVCQAMGWTTFLTDPDGGGGPPFSSSQSLLDAKQLDVAVGTIKRLWSGIKSVNDWLDQNAPAVSSEQAEKRAAVCVACPMNGQGDFSKWFVAPAAAAIKRQLEKLQNRKLATSQDDKLNICTGCLCANKLSVWVPAEIKLAHMAPETKAALHESCWVLAEERALVPA